MFGLSNVGLLLEPLKSETAICPVTSPSTGTIGAVIHEFECKTAGRCPSEETIGDFFNTVREVYRRNVGQKKRIAVRLSKLGEHLLHCPCYQF